MINCERPFGNDKTKYCTKCGYKLIEQTVSTELPKYKYKCTNCGLEFLRNNTYDYVENAVRYYWQSFYPQPVIAFFCQKYDFEDRWEWHEELIECDSDTDYETVTFLNDFCEGQTDIKCLHIVPLNDVLDYYFEHHKKLQE